MTTDPTDPTDPTAARIERHPGSWRIYRGDRTAGLVFRKRRSRPRTSRYHAVAYVGGGMTGFVPFRTVLDACCWCLTVELREETP